MIYTFVVIFFLGLWFLVSVLNQIQIKWFNKIKYRDIFAIIPSWSFFAPNPGRTDYHLLVRFETKNNNLSPWKNLNINRKTILSGIWNPEKRKQKTVTDCISEIKFLKIDYNSESIELTNAYLTLLSIALEHKYFEAKKIQFSIIETFGYFNTTQPNPILISNWHKV